MGFFNGKNSSSSGPPQTVDFDAMQKDYETRIYNLEAQLKWALIWFLKYLILISAAIKMSWTMPRSSTVTFRASWMSARSRFFVKFFEQNFNPFRLMSMHQTWSDFNCRSRRPVWALIKKSNFTKLKLKTGTSELISSSTRLRVSFSRKTRRSMPSPRKCSQLWMKRIIKSR